VAFFANLPACLIGLEACGGWRAFAFEFPGLPAEDRWPVPLRRAAQRLLPFKINVARSAYLLRRFTRAQKGLPGPRQGEPGRSGHPRNLVDCQPSPSALRQGTFFNRAVNTARAAPSSSRFHLVPQTLVPQSSCRQGLIAHQISLDYHLVSC
jgi:hypothetical protein